MTLCVPMLNRLNIHRLIAIYVGSIDSLKQLSGLCEQKLLSKQLESSKQHFSFLFHACTVHVSQFGTSEIIKNVYSYYKKFTDFSINCQTINDHKTFGGFYDTNQLFYTKFDSWRLKSYQY